MDTKKTKQIRLTDHENLFEDTDFELKGTVDLLPAVANALTFVLDNSDKLKKMRNAKHVYECAHCIKSMMMFLENIHAVLTETQHRTDTLH